MRTKPRPPRKNPIFTEFKRAKLLRKRIPLAEAVSGLSILVFLALATGWVHAKKDDYDPGERDLDLTLLAAKGAPEDLYDLPTQRWRDPALGPAAGAAPATDLGPFPVEILAGGWAAGRTQRFTPDTLYEKINGQAEQYLKFDFQELLVLPLQHPPSGTTVDVYVYEQSTFSNALGLYAEQRGDKEARSDGGALFTPTSLGAYGLAGSKVFHVIGTPEGPALREMTRRLIAALGSGSGGEGTPAPFQLLAENLGVPLDGIGYTPVNAFSLGFAERFWFGTPDPDGTARAFVHEAADEEAAREMARRLVEAQSAELEVLERGEDGVLAKHRFLGTHYLFAAEGRIVFGVEDHPSADGARALAAALRSGVRQLSFGPAPAVAAAPEPAPVDEPVVGEGYGSDEAGGGYAEGEGS